MLVAGLNPSLHSRQPLLPWRVSELKLLISLEQFEVVIVSNHFNGL